MLDTNLALAWNDKGYGDPTDAVMFHIVSEADTTIPELKEHMADIAKNYLATLDIDQLPDYALDMCDIIDLVPDAILDAEGITVNNWVSDISVDKQNETLVSEDFIDELFEEKSE